MERKAFVEGDIDLNIMLSEIIDHMENESDKNNPELMLSGK
ncbi:MAG: hypothetical protein ABFR32_13260 [Bacteroidota bacterium]